MSESKLDIDGPPSSYSFVISIFKHKKMSNFFNFWPIWMKLVQNWTKGYPPPQRHVLTTALQRKSIYIQWEFQHMQTRLFQADLTACRALANNLKGMSHRAAMDDSSGKELTLQVFIVVWNISRDIKNIIILKIQVKFHNIKYKAYLPIKYIFISVMKIIK